MTLAPFQAVPIVECGDALVEFSSTEFLLEPAYFRLGLSKSPRLFAREAVIEKLRLIQKQLHPLKLKIWDPYRSRQVQANIYWDYWRKLQIENPDLSDDELRKQVGTFVTFPSDPNRIPPHATGGAVDLTIADVHGNELPMGTGFDHFGPEASSLFYESFAQDMQIRKNRRLLRDAMESEGFRFDDEEWWHFDYGNQLWALALGKDSALYGECSDPTECDSA